MCLCDINISDSRDFRLNAETSSYYFETQALFLNQTTRPQSGLGLCFYVWYRIPILLEKLSLRNTVTLWKQ